MSYLSKLEKFKNSLRDQLPEQFYTLIDEYVPALIDMDGEILLEWVQAVLAGKPRVQRRLIREAMSPRNLAATIVKEKQLMKELHQKYGSYRTASAKFLGGLRGIALAALSAWVSSQIGIPVVITPK